jgi:hypothetical protein
MKFRKTVLACAAVALGSMAGAAQASFINGSATLAGGVALPDGLTNWPTSLVSLLTSFDLTGGALATNAGSSDLATIGFGTAGTINDFDTASSDSFVLDIAGFTFTSSSFGAASITTPFGCTTSTQGTTCGDAQSFSISGTVAGNGYDATFFTADFALTGSCVGATAPAYAASRGMQAGRYRCPQRARLCRRPIMCRNPARWPSWVSAWSVSVPCAARRRANRAGLQPRKKPSLRAVFSFLTW